MFTLLFALWVGAQPNKELQFVAYGKIPTWTAVASNWQGSELALNFYDPRKYPGHADFVSKGLKTGINFATFKQQVSHFDTRQYLPFFVHDLFEAPVELDGQTYHWAVHVEDYSYTDNTEEMAATVLRLMDKLSDELGPEKGLVLLATSPSVKPNAGIAAELNAKGYPNMTRSQLLTAFGGAGLQLLNKGTTCGYLRLVKAGNENSFIPSPNDIVVYEKLPKRVFPVRGIISLEPQHPLSHVNLLAKNRGTPNLSIEQLSDLPGIEKHMGQLVKLVCTDRKLMVSPVSLQEAKRLWEKQRVTIDIPEAVSGATTLTDLSPNSSDQKGIVHIGAKAANYALLLEFAAKGSIDQALIKPAAALPFGCYFRFVEDNQLGRAIDSLNRRFREMDRPQRQEALKSIRKRMKKGILNPFVVEQVRQQSKRLNCDRIRLRSSTNCEDLPDFNGAGLYLSKGFDWEDNDEKLAKKIKQVYASLWSELAFEERSYFGIDHGKAAMAILINPAFSDEYANGVLMSIPAKTGPFYLINSQLGEHSVSNPENDLVSEAVLYTSKLEQSQVQSKSTIGPVFLNNNLAAIRTQLLETAAHLHKHFTEDKPDYGIDIEFKVMKEGDHFQLYIKQIRLIGEVLPE